jgi:hypothetical protein
MLYIVFLKFNLCNELGKVRSNASNGDIYLINGTGSNKILHTVKLHKNPVVVMKVRPCIHAPPNLRLESDVPPGTFR